MFACTNDLKIPLESVCCMTDEIDQTITLKWYFYIYKNSTFYLQDANIRSSTFSFQDLSFIRFPFFSKNAMEKNVTHNACEKKQWANWIESWMVWCSLHHSTIFFISDQMQTKRFITFNYSARTNIKSQWIFFSMRVLVFFFSLSLETIESPQYSMNLKFVWIFEFVLNPLLLFFSNLFCILQYATVLHISNIIHALCTLLLRVNNGIWMFRTILNLNIFYTNFRIIFYLFEN